MKLPNIPLAAYFLFVTVMCSALSVQAGTSGLVRLTDRDDLFGWEAVGRVEVGQGGYCTGALIAPNLVLTAAHCVYGGGDQAIESGSLTFRAGLRDGISLADRKVGRYVVHKNYDPSLGTNQDSVRYDAALLELSEAIPTSIANPFALYGSAGKGRRVSVVSYGRGRDEALSWQPDCGVLEQGLGLLVFDCNVTFGSSGAPVFLRDGGRARILSLISAGGPMEGGTMSFGMELPEIVARLKRDLRAMPDAPNSRVGFRRVTVRRGGDASGAKFAKP